MIKSALFEPYYFKKNSMRRSTTFNTRNKPGVYMIYKNGVLRYVGFSKTNLYRTMYRHFVPWPDETQKRVVYLNLKGIKCRVIYCDAVKAGNLEKALIIKLKPKDNELKYWQTNTTDTKEEKVYSLYTGAQVKDIIINQDEIDL